MDAGSPSPDDRRGIVLVMLGAVLAAMLAWRGIGVHRELACTVNDTPYLEMCPQPATPQEQAAALRSRIAANPGDTRAYVRLALVDDASTRAGSIAAAARVAPTHPDVLARQAVLALERLDWRTAAAPLVSLVQYHHSERAALALARFIAAGQASMLAQFVSPGSTWVQSVLWHLPQAPAPVSAALPLVVPALKAGALPPEAVATYVTGLKARGAWADAYSLWLALHKKPLPLLYNGGFDQDFVKDGFDWEIPMRGPINKAGAIVDKSRAEDRGAVLEVRFTGRAMSMPIVRQQLFLGAGRYKFKGDYRASLLRIERGLAWFVRCGASPATIAGRSPTLDNSDAEWKSFEFDFTIPADCGAVATLQLETVQAVDAAVGSRGRASFDGFSVERLAR